MSWQTHPDAQAIFRSVLATPDDDAPRLVLADWLDENGFAERAEFIRLDCTLARDRFADELRDVRRRRHELYEAHKNAWYMEVASLSGVQWANMERGFLQRARLATAKTLNTKYNKLRQLTPVTQFQFTGRPPLEGLATKKWLADVRGLGVAHSGASTKDDDLVPVLRSPHLKRLDWLDAGSTSIGRDALEALAEAPAAAHLRDLRLYLTGMNLNVRWLAASPHIRALEELNIHSSSITTEDVVTLAQSPIVQKLRRLRIGDPFDPEAIHALMHAAPMAQLKHLILVRPRDLPAGVKIIAEAPQASSLRELTLMGYIDTDTLEALAYSPHMQNLEALTLLEAQVNDDGLRMLMRSPLRQLRQLHFSPTGLSDVVAQPLLESPIAQNLEQIAFDDRLLPKEIVSALRAQRPGRVSSSIPGLYPLET